MNIKTITCHDVYNAGASLQAYALSEYLIQQGHDVEIIDYKPEYLSRHYKFSVIYNPVFNKPIIKQLYLIANFPKRIFRYFSKRKVKFDKFKKEILKVTEQRYNSFEELNLSCPEADVFIAGSDQIWNPLFENGKDPAFFLDFVPSDKLKISYAASFAVDELSNSDAKRILPWLKDFDLISVRERSAVKILNQLGFDNVLQVCDPVFLLDRNHWLSFCKARNDSFEKYILVYDFDENHFVQSVAEKYAKEFGVKIYSVFKSNYADKSLNNIGPLEFVNYIKNASFVISNSFHATAFSLIFNKEFFVVNREENINTRMMDLLDNVGLTDRLVYCKEDAISFNQKIRWQSVNTKLLESVKSSKKYLENALSIWEEKTCSKYL